MSTTTRPLLLTQPHLLADRLKITLPTAYAIARLAFSCLYFHDVWAALEYDKQSMLYWCKREVKWGAYWLLKAHIPGGKKRTTKWTNKDQLVIMVRSCFWRSEH